MISILLTGRLIYVDTEKSELIIDALDGTDELRLGAKLKKWRAGAWEKMIGSNVEVAVVNDVAVGITDLDAQRKAMRK